MHWQVWPRAPRITQAFAHIYCHHAQHICVSLASMRRGNTLSMFYKGQSLRDARQHFGKNKGWGLAILESTRDSRWVGGMKGQIWHSTELSVSWFHLAISSKNLIRPDQSIVITACKYRNVSTAELIKITSRNHVPCDWIRAKTKSALHGHKGRGFESWPSHFCSN